MYVITSNFDLILYDDSLGLFFNSRSSSSLTEPSFTSLTHVFPLQWFHLTWNSLLSAENMIRT